jgi:hypothetical protein
MDAGAARTEMDVMENGAAVIAMGAVPVMPV